MEYEKIPEHVLWFAKCHYCGISNPVFSSGPFCYEYGDF